jgi:hypothetical protein
VKKSVTAIILLAICTSAVILLFEQLIATSVKLPILLAQSVETVIVTVSGSIIILLIRRFRHIMGKRIGLHPATIFSFFMVLITILIMIFLTLDLLQVSPTSLLLG